jgi:hypothetical protein
MAIHFEFDTVNKILLTRIEGRVTNESALDIYSAIQKYSTETDARVTITDLSSVTEFNTSADFIRLCLPKTPAGSPPPLK